MKLVCLPLRNDRRPQIKSQRTESSAIHQSYVIVTASLCQKHRPVAPVFATLQNKQIAQCATLIIAHTTAS